jgi:carboxyl-terminal processing protease
MRLFQSLVIVGLLNIGLITGHDILAKVDVEEQQQLLEELKKGKIPQFTPEEHHPLASQIITNILVNYHYKKPLIDNAFSEQVLEAYLDRLDGNHSYFTLKDVADFGRFKHRIDNNLRFGDVSPAYEIFNVFLKRWVYRYQQAIKLLDEPMDFTLDEYYEYDREEAGWAIDEKALDEVWRKRVKNDVLNLKLSGKEMPEIKELLTKRYKASLRRMAQSNSQDVFWHFMNAVAMTVEPHTNYFSPRIAENFKIDMKLSLDGIGAVLQSEDVYTKVVSLVPKGPADKTGEVKKEDRIIAVGQGEEPMVDVIGWRLDDVVDLIRGKSGTVVRLEILPKNAGADANTKLVTITRDTVKLEEQAAKAEVLEIPRGDKVAKFGVIDIPKFYVDFDAMYSGAKDYKSTTRDVAKLINELTADGVEGIIIDLRNNGGGALVEAIDLTGLFIKNGPVVQERDYKNDIRVRSDNDPSVVYNGPLAVLVNRSSASASEIFAGAIQDYGRGLILGGQTYGKGTVQVVKSLDRKAREEGAMGQLKFTWSKYYRINGESTQHKGVIPDIAFPSLYDGSDYGESSQPNALPWDTITAADYIPVSDVKPVLPRLKEAHKNRVLTDKDFRELVEDIDDYLERSEEKAVSLNYEQRMKTRKEREQKLIDRENRRLMALGLEKISSIDEIDEEQERPDPLLDETAQILKDYIELIDGQKIAYVESAEAKRNN